MPKPWSATDFSTFQENRRKAATTPSDAEWKANESATTTGASRAGPRIAQGPEDVEEDTIDETGVDPELRVNQIPADRPHGE